MTNIAASAALAALVVVADLPLTVGPLVTGPNSHVQLTNTSNQPVTAWSLETTTPGKNGGIRREVETVDGYLSEVTKGLAGASPRLDRLLPGESRTISLDRLPSDAAARIIAGVLDDGTAIGDEEAIASIFERRAAERDAFRSVVEVFNGVLPSLHGIAALDVLRDRLTAMVQQNPAVPCRAALDAVETYRRNATAATSADEIDQSLRRYAGFVARQRELAEKHSHRRSG